VITNLSVDKDAEKKNVLWFRASMEQVIIVETLRGELPEGILNELIKSRAESEKKAGQKVKLQTKLESGLLKLAQIFGF